MGRPRANEAVCLVSTRDGGINVRVLSVRFRIEGALHPIGRGKGAIYVNDHGRLFHQVSDTRRVACVDRARRLNPFQGRFLVFVRRRFSPIVRKGRFRRSSFAHDLWLPECGVTIVLRSEGGRFVTFLRLAINGEEDRRISALHHTPYGRSFVTATYVSGAACDLAEDFVRLNDLLERRVRAAVRVNVSQVVFVNCNFGRLTQFLDNDPVVRVGGQLSVRLPVWCQGVFSCFLCVMRNILFACHASLAFVRLAARAFFRRRVRAIFRYVRTSHVCCFVSGDGRGRWAYFLRASAALLRVRRHVFVRLASDDSIETFCIVHVGFRLQLDMRVNVADDARITINLLKVDVLYSFACRCFSNGHAYHLVVRCVFGRLVADTVDGLIIGRDVVIRLFVLVNGSRAARVSLDSASNRDCFDYVAHDAIVRDRAVRGRVAIYLLIRVRIARARYTNVNFFRFVGVRDDVFFYGSLGGLDEGRVCVVRNVVAGRRADLHAFFRRGRRATIRRGVGVDARCIRRLGKFIRRRTFQRVRRGTVLNGDDVRNNRAVLKDVYRLTVVLLSRDQVLFERLFRTTGRRSFQRLYLQRDLAVGDVICCGVGDNARVECVTLRRFVQVRQGIRSIRVRAVVQLRRLTRVHVFVLLLFTNERAWFFRVYRDLHAKDIRRLNAVPTGRHLALEGRVGVLLFYSRGRFLL